MEMQDTRKELERAGLEPIVVEDATWSCKHVFADFFCRRGRLMSIFMNHMGCVLMARSPNGQRPLLVKMGINTKSKGIS